MGWLRRNSPAPVERTDIAIGNLVNGGDILEGGIDEVAIRHRALSADEIAALAGR